MNAVARKAAIAGPMLTCLVLSAMSGPAAAGGSRVDAIARATGVTPSEVQMVLGPRTPHPEYFTSFDRAQRRMIRALGPERFRDLMAGREIVLDDGQRLALAER